MDSLAAVPLGRRRRKSSVRSKPCGGSKISCAPCLLLGSPYRPLGVAAIEKSSTLDTRVIEVWWCPTSVLCSLPLYAAGSIESDGCGKRYFSGVYVSSYAPTHSALIEPRRGTRPTHTHY
ncbi:hypothetical protein EI94DRAFT_958595 [Lactarius quietus]|nr:hypothetical protein EI94DRAFT_958595 [Lactarius quietus]